MVLRNFFASPVCASNVICRSRSFQLGGECQFVAAIATDGQRQSLRPYGTHTEGASFNGARIHNHDSDGLRNPLDFGVGIAISGDVENFRVRRHKSGTCLLL